MEETTNQTTESSEATASQESSFAIPEQYQGKGWTEKVSNYDDLWKLTDNSQSLIGKRPAGIPDANASDAEWEKFNKALGVPEEASYEYSDYQAPEGINLPEDFDFNQWNDTASKLFHKAALTPKQAKILRDEYLNHELGAAQQTQTMLDEQYYKITNEVFGDEYKKYEDMTIETFDKYSPQNLKGAISQIADKPEALAAIVATIKGLKGEIDGVKKEYGAEGSTPSGEQTSGKTYDDVLKELTNIRISKDYRDFTRPEHKNVVEKHNELQATLARMKR